MSFLVKLTKKNISIIHLRSIEMKKKRCFGLSRPAQRRPVGRFTTTSGFSNDRDCFIPDILNSIKLIFAWNECQGIRIWCLFFEINLFCNCIDHFKTSAKQFPSHSLQPPFWNIGLFSDFRCTLHNRNKYFPCLFLNKFYIFRKPRNISIWIYNFLNCLLGGWQNRDLNASRCIAYGKRI